MAAVAAVKDAITLAAEVEGPPCCCRRGTKVPGIILFHVPRPLVIRQTFPMMVPRATGAEARRVSHHDEDPSGISSSRSSSRCIIRIHSLRIRACRSSRSSDRPLPKVWRGRVEAHPSQRGGRTTGTPLQHINSLVWVVNLLVTWTGRLLSIRLAASPVGRPITPPAGGHLLGRQLLILLP